jgi:hypothetical protein
MARLDEGCADLAQAHALPGLRICTPEGAGFTHDLGASLIMTLAALAFAFRLALAVAGMASSGGCRLKQRAAHGAAPIASRSRYENLLGRM